MFWAKLEKKKVKNTKSFKSNQRQISNRCTNLGEKSNQLQVLVTMKSYIFLRKKQTKTQNRNLQELIKTHNRVDFTVRLLETSQTLSSCSISKKRKKILRKKATSHSSEKEKSQNNLKSKNSYDRENFQRKKKLINTLEVMKRKN